MKWLLLIAGGGLGAALRFALASWVDQRVPAAFPWGTFAVNIAGCFAIGLLVSWADARGALTPALRLFLVAGILGGFTTFSTFGLETWQLIEDGQPTLAFANATASVLAGLTAIITGTILGRALA